MGSGFIEGLGLRAYIGPGVWFRVDFGLRVWSLGCAWVSEVGHGTRSLSVANLSMAHEKAPVKLQVFDCIQECVRVRVCW